MKLPRSSKVERRPVKATVGGSMPPEAANDDLCDHGLPFEELCGDCETDIENQADVPPEYWIYLDEVRENLIK